MTVSPKTCGSHIVDLLTSIDIIDRLSASVLCKVSVKSWKIKIIPEYWSIEFERLSEDIYKSQQVTDLSVLRWCAGGRSGPGGSPAGSTWWRRPRLSPTSPLWGWWRCCGWRLDPQCWCAPADGCPPHQLSTKNIPQWSVATMETFNVGKCW